MAKRKCNNAQPRRTGILLAAGVGTRLANHRGEYASKVLLRVDGIPLVLHAIRSLAAAGCERAICVLGHAADIVERQVRGSGDPGLPVHFVRNPDFHLSNGISVLSARPFVATPHFVLMMADHLFGPEVLQTAVAHTPPDYGATLLVDYKIGTVFDLEDATKVLARADRVCDIGKSIPESNCIDTGLFVSTAALFGALEQVWRAEGDVSVTQGVRRLAAENRMHALDIGEGRWQDVDTPEMLHHARRLGFGAGATEARLTAPSRRRPDPQEQLGLVP